MTTIAMTREMGSLGKFVAEGLAADLELKLMYHEVIDSVSEKMHLSGSEVTRFLHRRTKPTEKFREENDAPSLYTAAEVLNIAADGKLMIRGWGATAVLRPVSHVLRVRVCAPMETRIRHMMERLRMTDPELAHAEIKRNDDAHGAAMQRRFGIDHEDPAHYDLVLDTGQLSITTCIEQIKAMARKPAYQETLASRAKLLDLALAAQQQAELKTARYEHRALRDTVLHNDEKCLVEDLSMYRSGVSAGENQHREGINNPQRRRTLNG